MTTHTGDGHTADDPAQGGAVGEPHDHPAADRADGAPAMSETLDRPETTFDVLSRADAKAYAAAVRAHLSDLSAEELDELTGGLEADLAEVAAESATPLAARLGEPRAYADELRAAAGLAPKTLAARAFSRIGRPSSGPARLRPANRLHDWLSAQPWWPQLRDFAVTLRPAWWVLRAWIAFASISYLLGVYPRDVLPDTVGGWVALLGLVIVSVQLGRTRLEQAHWLRTAVVVGNVAAVIMIPNATAQASDHWMAYESQSAEPVNGLFLDGEPVLNIFPYGADGEPLSGVQLFDANGRPLLLTARDDYSGPVGRPFAPYTDANGRRVWSAYPLYVGRYDSSGVSYRPGSVRLPTGPFVIAPAVTAPLPAVTPEPTQTPTPGPSSTADPTPTPTPIVSTPTPSSTPTPTPS